MPELDGALVIPELLAWAIGFSVATIGGTLCGAVRALWKGNQESAELNRQILRDVTTAEKEDAVFKEKLTRGLDESRKAQEAMKASMHARLDRIELRLP